MYQNDKVYVRIQVSDSILASISPDMRSNSYRPDATFGGHSGKIPSDVFRAHQWTAPAISHYEFLDANAATRKRNSAGYERYGKCGYGESRLGDVQGYQLPMTTLQAGAEANQFYVWKMEDGQAFKSEVEVDKISGQGALIVHGVEQQSDS